MDCRNRDLTSAQHLKRRTVVHSHVALESIGLPPAGAVRCDCGCEMRAYQVRIDRRVRQGSGIGRWEPALSYDQWVCDACGERIRRPARPLGQRLRGGDERQL